MPLTIAEATTLNEDGHRPKQVAFLTVLADCGSIQEAADTVGIDRRSHYDWLVVEQRAGIDTTAEDQAPEGSYLAAFSRAKRMYADRIRERSERHAISEKEDMPAVVNRIFQIKRYFPEYRDQLNVKHSGSVLQARVDLNQLDPEERADLLRLTQRRLLMLESGENVAPDSSEGE